MTDINDVHHISEGLHNDDMEKIKEKSTYGYFYDTILYIVY